MLVGWDIKIPRQTAGEESAWLITCCALLQKMDGAIICTLLYRKMVRKYKSTSFYESSTYQRSFEWSDCKFWVRFQQSPMHLECILVSALLNSYVTNSMNYEIAAWWAVRKSYPINMVTLRSCAKQEFKHRYTTLFSPGQSWDDSKK